ncbi:LOW QUALITY PROTEIN: tetratricopeptide repeat protein 38-like [Centruroides vittatus]|uniref:LOW QUALITY PROTEIN: tetratricopeptide repeat protein 38-like n=1 Tax=Centruroides vittatus TaxID=120091 RepID=UPI0035100BCA
MNRDSWRGSKDWENEGLPLSTGSDHACKLYDAAITQYTGWYEDSLFGGLQKTIESIKATDPNFVMGHVLSVGLDLIGTGRSKRLDKLFQKEIDDLCSLSQSQKFLTNREKQHVEAVKLWSEGLLDEAIIVWEDILLHHPEDILALKLAHDTYFYQGKSTQMRDSVARVMPYWKIHNPLHSYLYGMYAFGLEETNLYRKAETMAITGLEMNSKDAWATHALAHVYEMEGRVTDGINLFSSTESDWVSCGMLATHNFWHWCLCYIEKGEYEAAFDIFDREMSKRMQSGAMLDIVDVTSLLYRLELEGCNVKDRWNEVHNICAPHIEDHILAFNDIHLLMSCLGGKQEESLQKLLGTMELGRSNKFYNNTWNIQEKLCKAFVAYDNGDYETTVNLLYPIRYEIFKIGGSHAQRDVFNLLLISAAIKSLLTAHHKIARNLLIERKASKENSPMTERLIAKALACHAD